MIPTYGAVAVIALVFVTYFFALTMTTPLNRNEHMYIAASKLLESGWLYSDFAYLQTPCIPHVYSSIFRLAGSSYLVLIARLVTFVSLVSAAIFLGLLVHRLTRDAVLSLVSVTLFSCSYHIGYIGGESSNYAPSLCFSTAAVYFFIAGTEEDGSKMRMLRLFVSGAFAGAAVCAKLYYAPFALALAVLCALATRHRCFEVRSARDPLACLAGLVFGLVPIFVYAFRDAPAFWFNNVGFHVLNSRWYGFPDLLALGHRVTYVYRTILEPTSLLLALGVLYGVLGLGASARYQGWTKAMSQRTVVVGALLGTSGLIAVSPTPLWEQYFAVPVPFAILAICVFLHESVAVDRNARRLFVIGLALMTITVASGRIARPVTALFRPAAWAGLSVHKTANQIRAHVNSLNQRPLIATFSPAFALEAGAEIYRELASTIFLYRLADLLSASERERYATTSPNTIKDFLDRRPPDAILVGQEKEWDELLTQYSLEKGYRGQGLPGGLWLWIKQAGSHSDR